MLCSEIETLNLLSLPVPPKYGGIRLINLTMKPQEID